MTFRPEHLLSFDLAKSYADQSGGAYTEPEGDMVALNLNDVANTARQKYDEAVRFVEDFIQKNGLNKPIGQDIYENQRKNATPNAEQRGKNYLHNRYNYDENR